MLESGHVDKRNNMRYYLEGIDRITDCVRKKEYLDELKKRQPAEIKVDVKMTDTQKLIAKQLSDF